MFQKWEKRSPVPCTTLVPILQFCSRNGKRKQEKHIRYIYIVGMLFSSFFKFHSNCHSGTNCQKLPTVKICPATSKHELHTTTHNSHTICFIENPTHTSGAYWRALGNGCLGFLLRPILTYIFHLPWTTPFFLHLGRWFLYAGVSLLAVQFCTPRKIQHIHQVRLDELLKMVASDVLLRPILTYIFHLPWTTPFFLHLGRWSLCAGVSSMAVQFCTPQKIQHIHQVRLDELLKMVASDFLLRPILTNIYFICREPRLSSSIWD